MPNRLIREGILTSEAVNTLNWAEEVFYRRLMSVVDDFGRYYASPKLLRAACYPLHIDKVSDSDIGKWLTACVTAALVRVYPAPDGKRYLELLNFRQQVRAKESKFPPMLVGDGDMLGRCAADAKQLKSFAHLGGGGDGVVDEGGGATVGLSKIVDNSTKPPPMSAEFREVLKSRAELDPDTVWQNFTDHYTAEKRTLGRWKKWVSTEYAPKANGPSAAAISDPDSRSSIEAEGVQKGIGKWDENREHWPAYKARVRGLARASLTVSDLSRLARMHEAA